ncbi:MAG TPA: polysaccharide deacetylase family protein [Candidatus Acidoferrales bacterium]|nr:polysaccharide deacetylase family protein [Candidatus Acidoferrales bacterium]
MPHCSDIVIFSSHPPRAVARLVSQIHAEVPKARVRGILYQLPPRKGISLRDGSWLRRGLLKGLEGLGSMALRFIHACPARPNGPVEFGLADLIAYCKEQGCTILTTRNLQSPEATQFVRELRADLGIVYGTRTTEPELFALPRHGSILVHKGGVPDCEDTTPPGYPEMAEGHQLIHVSVRRFGTPDKELNSSTLPIDPYDTLTSIALKTRLVGKDLLVRTVADFVQEKVKGIPASRPGKDSPSPAPALLNSYENRKAFVDLFFRSMRGRPEWKLLLKSVLFLPWLVLRNWSRRVRGSAPVIILYHHLVSDRPHYLGVPTETFFRHVEFLKRHYRIASLEEATEALKSGRVRTPTVVLTLDDGYQENFINLRAIADETGIAASLFISTAYITEQRIFQHDQKRLEYGFLPLTWEQICCMHRSGFEIGSHTRTHFDCGSSDPVALEREIAGAKEDLDLQVGQRVKFFSFPWGQPSNMSPEAVAVARSAYPYVLSAHGGENLPSRNGPPWHLRRRHHFNDLWELELELQAILGG